MTKKNWMKFQLVGNSDRFSKGKRMVTGERLCRERPLASRSVGRASPIGVGDGAYPPDTPYLEITPRRSIGRRNKCRYKCRRNVGSLGYNIPSMRTYPGFVEAKRIDSPCGSRQGWALENQVMNDCGG